MRKDGKICLECVKNITQLYDFRDALCDFFVDEPRENSHSCIVCSKYQYHMEILSNYLLINRNRYKLFDVLLELCNFEVEIDENDSICGKCSESLNNSYKFHLICKNRINIREDTVIIRKELDRKKRPYQCDECPKSYIRSDHLKYHMGTHTGKKPFKCAECIKRFSRKYELKRHIKVHTGIKPYNCKFCIKTFGRIDYLKSHLMRIHNAERP